MVAPTLVPVIVFWVMLVQHSFQTPASITNPSIQQASNSVSESFLRKAVETISIPRHFEFEADNNHHTAEWIVGEFRSYGYCVEIQGECANVIALPKAPTSTPLILVGAHYDSVPGCPGADDNASAVAAMLACAQAIAQHAPDQPICFVAFNREEDGLLGSTEFTNNIARASQIAIREAHILEMVGFCDHRPGTQSLPPGLPIQIPDAGDFLGILANRGSAGMADTILQAAKTYCPEFPALALKVFVEIEMLPPVLLRSDHTPFWKAGIPAVMWTDTSEYRNHNYHQASDTPDTLDYKFLRAVTQVLIATVLP